MMEPRNSRPRLKNQGTLAQVVNGRYFEDGASSGGGVSAAQDKKLPSEEPILPRERLGIPRLPSKVGQVGQETEDQPKQVIHFSRFTQREPSRQIRINPLFKALEIGIRHPRAGRPLVDPSLIRRNMRNYRLNNFRALPAAMTSAGFCATLRR